VAALPLGSQVHSSVSEAPGSRILVEHIVDRACVGHCFSFNNFEVNSGAFRVRATPGNEAADDSVPSSPGSEREGNAAASSVQPVFEIYRCDFDAGSVCMRKLLNDRSSLR
jgi:hypothetical protein